MRRAQDINATWNDFIRLPDDDRRELIDGRLIELEMPRKLHEWIVMLLGHYLTTWALKTGAGLVLGPAYKVRINERRGVMPDIQLLSHETFENAPDSGLDNAHPELVVEIISPSSKSYDRITKREYYAALGVPEYWIVDCDAKKLERLVLGVGGYHTAQTASGNAVFKPTGFKGLKIPLAQMWSPPKKKP